ncbi:MAG: DUF4406 domain-containing protein [Treponema sp.]|nr:DUF4406 domain-containing protein [Treponema sp.]
MTVYLSGRITGNENWQNEFQQAEEVLIKKGFIVLSPRMITAPLEYEEFMHIDFAMIDICEAVIFLENATSSLGAIRERRYAEAKNKYCIDFKDIDLFKCR